jgi:hypothetical protein
MLNLIPLTYLLLYLPTKVRSKCMMKHKGKEQMEKDGSLPKIT